MDDNWLGKRIKRLRDERGLSQAELAEKVNIEIRTLQAIESGDTRMPQPRTRRLLAEALGMTTVNELMTPAQDHITTNASQVSDTASASGGTVTPTQEGMTEPRAFTNSIPTEAPTDVPSPRTRRGRRNKGLILSLTIITVAVMATAGIVYWALIGKAMFNTISGQVTCPDNQPVVGIYVVPVNGDSKEVTKQFLNSSESVAKFTYTLPNGGGYNLHAGCGHAPSGQWRRTYWTEMCSGTVEDHDFHAFIIYDQLPADRSKPCLVRYGK